MEFLFRGVVFIPPLLCPVAELVKDLFPSLYNYNYKSLTALGRIDPDTCRNITEFNILPMVVSMTWRTMCCW